jgi:hypothetical protein
VDVSNSQVQIVGIRGWLIFPAIGIIVGFIQNTINIINHASFIESHTADEALHLIPSLIIQMVLLVWLVVIAAQFFKKKRVLPYNIVRFLIGRSVAYLLLFILGNEVYSFIAIVIAAIFWIPYFKFSKRVKATFVN